MTSTATYLVDTSALARLSVPEVSDALRPRIDVGRVAITAVPGWRSAIPPARAPITTNPSDESSSGSSSSTAHPAASGVRSRCSRH